MLLLEYYCKVNFDTCCLMGRRPKCVMSINRSKKCYSHWENPKTSSFSYANIFFASFLGDFPNCMYLVHNLGNRFLFHIC